jgi:hypothetical protein
MVTSMPMFWIGGTPGSGKSTTASQLARELDLALHPVDAYTYDHLERLGHLGPPLDDVLALGAVAAADDFERTSALRLPTVMDDVRTAQVEGVPTLVEGPQLHPRAAATWSPIGAIWLITTAERTRTARRQRLVDGDDAARLRVEALVERDQVIGARLRSAASEAGCAVIEVPTDVDWDDVVAAVRGAINAVTASTPSLRRSRGFGRAGHCRHDDAVRTMSSFVRSWRMSGISAQPSRRFPTHACAGAAAAPTRSRPRPPSTGTAADPRSGLSAATGELHRLWTRRRMRSDHDPELRSAGRRRVARRGMRYDRAHENLDRHANDILASFTRSTNGFAEERAPLPSGSGHMAITAMNIDGRRRGETRAGEVTVRPRFSVSEALN